MSLNGKDKPNLLHGAGDFSVKSNECTALCSRRFHSQDCQNRSVPATFFEFGAGAHCLMKSGA